jgi:hypothetical protein
MGDEKDKQRVSLEGEEKYNDALIAGSITGEFGILTNSRMQFILCMFLSKGTTNCMHYAHIHSFAARPLALNARYIAFGHSSIMAVFRISVY